MIDENINTGSWTTAAGATATHGPFIIAVDIPSSKLGQQLNKVILKWGGESSYPNGYGTVSLKVGYRRSSTNYSLNVSSIDMTTSTGTTNTGTVTFSNDTNWHIASAATTTNTITLNLTSKITLQTGDKILIRWLDSNTYKHMYFREITLNGVSESSFSTISNVEIDYTKGTGNNNLRDSNGFDVSSFEITNGTNTTGIVPAYASIATASNNIEVTFNQTLVDPGSLNKDDFHVTYNGSVTGASPSISGGKLVLTGMVKMNTTSYDISSDDSTLSGQAYTASNSYNANYGPAKAFDTTITGDKSRWASSNMSGTTTIDGSSVTGPWLQIDIGQSVVVDKFTIYFNHVDQCIKTAKVASSTDGSTWTEIHAIDRVETNGVTETFNIAADKIHLARYYRIAITSVHGSSIATVREWTLFGVTQAQTTAPTNFTSTSNLVVDYLRHHSTKARRLQNADGDEVASFEITNGTITNDQTKPTFSSVAVVNGKLELTFSENIAVTGTLNKEDFTVDSGTAVSISSVAISNGKILISKPAYSLGSTTPYDLSSSSSSLSGQTNIHILQDGWQLYIIKSF